MGTQMSKVCATCKNAIDSYGCCTLDCPETSPAPCTAIETKLARLERAYDVLFDFVNRYAGPEGSGCQVGSMQHFAQTVKAKAEAILGGKDDKKPNCRHPDGSECTHQASGNAETEKPE